MTIEAELDTRTGSAPDIARRTRHRGRWIVVSVVVILVLVGVAVGIYTNFSAEPPLALPTTAAGAPVGSPDGTWMVAAGSVAGYRIQQTVLGLSGDVVGRTKDVTGTIVVANDVVDSGTFSIDLTTVTAAGKVQPQFATSLDTRDHPRATFTLARPITLGPAFASGESIAATATGQLALNGTSRPVTARISGRRDGSTLEVVGSIPVAFSDWGIRGPTGYGALGSLADHGVAEFLLILHRA